MFNYLEENLTCSKEHKRRPRPTQGCRTDDDDDDDDDDEKIIMSMRNQKSAS